MQINTYTLFIKDYMVYDTNLIIKAGIFAALVKAFWGLVANYFGLTKMDYSLYLGCLVAGKKSKNSVLVIGLLLQVIMGILFAFVYGKLFELLNWQSTPLHGMLIGLVQWLIAGTFLHFWDKINACVHNNTLPSVGVYALHYGYRGAFAYLVGYLLFGLTIAYML